ncbi:Hemolysin [Pandoraea sp. SD6-2]|nr:Hemolysin [Pandoraea sp. SD6-2]
MKKSRFTDSQIMNALKRVAAGLVAPDLCRELGISTATFYKWRSKYGGMDVSLIARMKELEAENARLRKMYVEEKLKAEIVVVEQSGIQAGSGGFDVNVTGNTDLKGAYIASTADASKNQLTTGTLTFSDMENHSDYSANSFGVGGGFTMGNGGANERTTGPTSGKNTGGISPMLPQSESGSERGTTRSGVSGGTITLTNGASQTQDLASLNRDTTNLNDTVSRTPDLQNLLNDQSRLMAAATAAGEAVARDIGSYANRKEEEAKEKAKNTEDPTLKAQYLQEAKDWSEGGDYRAAMHAAGGAIVAGLGGGNALGAGLMSKLGGVLNDLSNKIQDAHPTGNADIDQALAQIVTTGLGTAIGAAAGGTSGAFTGFNTDRFNRQLYPDEYKKAAGYAKVVAKELGISEAEAEGRVLAEMLRNSDKQTAEASGGKHDYDIRRVVGCQNLNCAGDVNDPQYANHDFNSHYIKSNEAAYNLGQEQLGRGQTYGELVTSNMKKDPVGSTLAGVGMIGLGLVMGGPLASAGLMGTGGLLGLGANGGVQPMGDRPFDWTSFALAGATGAASTGMKVIPVALTGVGGALTGSALQGQNPNSAMAGALGGTAIGYPIGSRIQGSLNVVV